jgi:hypothetical protein
MLRHSRGMSSHRNWTRPVQADRNRAPTELRSAPAPGIRQGPPRPVCIPSTRENHGESAAALRRPAGLLGIRLRNEDHCAARQYFSNNAEERRRSALTDSSIRRNCDSLTPPHLAPQGLTTSDDALIDAYLSCLLHSAAPLAKPAQLAMSARPVHSRYHYGAGRVFPNYSSPVELLVMAACTIQFGHGLLLVRNARDCPLQVVGRKLGVLAMTVQAPSHRHSRSAEARDQSRAA